MSSGTDAQQFVDLPAKAIELINSAQRSIDATFYYFDIPAVTDALIAAKNRGVQVRLILGQGNSPTEAARLDPAGIPYIFSNYGGNHAAGIMQGKYILVDAAPGRRMTPTWDGLVELLRGRPTGGEQRHRLPRLRNGGASARLQPDGQFGRRRRTLRAPRWAP